MTTETISSLGHVIWLAGPLPDLAWLVVRMAVDIGRLERVKLWSVGGKLHQDQRIAALLATGNVELCDLESLTDAGLDAATAPGTCKRLRWLDEQLEQPAARADLARLRVLWQDGGIYLDADALCLQDLQPLRSLDGFCGLERIALPAALYKSRNPLRWARAGALLALRHVLSQRIGAGARFAQFAELFDLACNNAILGAMPHHPFVAKLLHDIARMPLPHARTLYELGPRLLEIATDNQSLPAQPGRPGWEVLPPHFCYPLAPVVCADYVFYDPEARLGATPHPQAVVAHLYDSVLARRIGQRLDLAWLQAHRDRTLLGRMVRPWLDELRQAAQG